VVWHDIFYFIEHGTLYNYADDNTLSYADQDYNTLINVLENESSILIEWFNFNCTDDLKNTSRDNPKHFWKMLGGQKRKQQPNIEINTLYEFFKDLRVC
jgi:basic membrane lipoprotein Med (substrate-binding protein (PBP1-ABC) superfamily)